MSSTPNIALPYLAAGQAQKHVTLNEALRILDVTVQLSVRSRQQAAPPAAPGEGDAYIVPAAPSGAWATFAGKVAAFQDGGWNYFAPRTGWLAWLEDEAQHVVFHADQWQLDAAATALPYLGINTAGETTNRLKVQSGASLFNHDGGNHRLYINKGSASDTASVIFQSAFVGRAEIGLTGSNDLALRYSADGTSWSDLLKAGSGAVEVPNSAQVQKFVVGPHEISTSFGSGPAAMEICSAMTGDRVAYFDFHASDAQPDYSARVFRFAGANADFELENVGTGTLRMRSGGAVSLRTQGVDRVTVTAGGNLEPAQDNAISLGNSGARFSAIWAANGVIQTSDLRDKTIEGVLPDMSAGRIVDLVEPVLFRWKVGGNAVSSGPGERQPINPGDPASKNVTIDSAIVTPRPGQRIHAGFRAQDVKRALDTVQLDIAAWGLENRDDPDSRQWLRPDQLVPLLWSALRQTRSELAVLREELSGQR